MSQQIMNKAVILLILICTVSLVLLQCSTDDIAGGSGAETGNAKIVGVIADTSGLPVAHVNVFLFPASYNPLTDTLSGFPVADTTDSYGKYSYTVSLYGSYTIVAKSPSEPEYSFVSVTVDSELISAPDAVLKTTGVINVRFPSGSEINPGYVYISGTSLRSAIIDSTISAGFVCIDSVPEGHFASVSYTTGENHTVEIAQQVNVTSGATTFVDLCLCALNGSGYDAQPPKPVQTSYYSYGGATLTRNAWQGSYVAFLTKRKDLDPCIMRRLLTVMDSAYWFNEYFLGQVPPIDKHYQGLLSIAEAPYIQTGLFNGAIGVTGIEMGEDQFERLYTLVGTENRFLQELFFVLANNFNSYMRRLTHSNNVKYSTAVSRGFSVFMRFTTMENIGIEAASFKNLSLNQYHSKIENLLDLYLADSSFRFSNSFATDTLQFSDLKSEHLFASLLLRLGKHYGNTFLEKLWREVDKRPVTTSTQTAVDNLVLASCIAAGSNITTQFVSWKIPVSEKTKSEAASLFP